METGRPPVFATPEEMQAKIEEYFEYVKGDFREVEKKVMDEDHDECTIKVRECIREPENVTITGLALYLGFESRQSFYDNEKRNGFSYIIKRARMRVENGYENRLIDSKNPTGSIFALKNMGWTDKQEIDQRTELSGTVGFSGIQIVQPDDPNPQVPS